MDKTHYVVVEPGGGAFECDVPANVIDQGDAALEAFIDDAMVAAIPAAPAEGDDDTAYRQAVDLVERRKARKAQHKLPFGTTAATRRSSRTTAAAPQSQE